MIGLFLKERLSWILFFLVTCGWINLIFALDSGFAGVSVVYFNLILIVSFCGFLVWRYFYETNNVKTMLNLDFERLKEMQLSPFEQLYVQVYVDEIERKEQDLNEFSLLLLEEKDDLLAWVHDMKTPLTAQKLMLDQVGDMHLRRKLENEWMRMYLLLDRQLHQTRLQTIEKDNQMEQVALKQTLAAEIRPLQSWCMEKGIGFELNNVEQVVVSDAKWVAFILRQLLSNAVKYSHDNNVVTIWCEQDAQGHTVLCIKDQGIGMKREDVERIFLKSYTGNVGRESTTSTGMGLYLAKNAATQLGIKIEVESVFGQGSCFKVIFPLENDYMKMMR